MAHVIFYEKPGCGGNARQKALLVASGHEVDARNLLTTPWDDDSLKPFFGDKPVREWFNTASPRVKAGEINIEKIAPHEALALMIADPGLVRRPLMRVGNRCESGFDAARVDAWIGLAPANEKVNDTCVRSSSAPTL
jgi:nitrogenase-associated protein